jgi:glucose/arabinose dehydrogenase
LAQAVSANPVEVRRIFSLGLPYNNHHAGGLMFGPIDKYLYYPLGDGGGEGDIWNFAQNLNVLLGKFMRFDVDKIPSECGHHFTSDEFSLQQLTN